MNTKKILVIQIGKIGDMILTTPLLDEIKKIYPDSELTVLASKRNSIISNNLSSVDNTVIFDKRIFHLLKLLIKFKRKSFDIWIDAKDEHSTTSKMLESICKPKQSLGFNIKENVFDIDLSNFVYGTHRIDINLSPINYFKNERMKRNVLPRINIPDIDSKNVISRIKNINGKKVLLNLSVGIDTRDLEIEKWLEIVNGINTDFNVILSGEKNAYDNIKRIIKESKRNNIFLVETNSIFELAELIKLCDLLVTPDTSAVHLASCFNTPIVCFFHNVEWVRIKFSPLSEKQKIIVSKDENSFKSLTPQEILNAIGELVSI